MATSTPEITTTKSDPFAADNEPPARKIGLDVYHLTEGERFELTALGLLTREGKLAPPPVPRQDPPPAPKKPISSHDVLNEAYDYDRPASFSRGMRVPLGDFTLLLISGTASVGDDGQSLHVGDFRAQCWRTYRNITRLLESEGANWHDVVRCTCYLRDIERDYRAFNEVRTAFFEWLKLDPIPASTGIQARLCREDLLVEIEAIAVIPSSRR